MSETEKAESPKPPKPEPTIREQAERAVNRKITGAISQARARVAPLTDAACEQLVAAQAIPADQFAELLEQLTTQANTQP